MCGIAGFIDSRTVTGDDELHLHAAAMADTLRHRGPDDGGTWVDAAAGVALGHRRLSIIDLSPQGHQPMVSRSGRWVLSFNGEIYNYRDIRDDLRSRGASFRGESDTEVLLEGIDTLGLTQVLDRSKGMFAFAAWDRDQRRLHLVRDRMGEKPLYYGWSGSTFAFASELKALRAVPGFTFDVNRDALAAFLRHNCVPAPHSIYRGVFKLLPGTTLEIDPRRPGTLPEPRTYWSVRQAAEEGTRDPLAVGESQATDALESVLTRAVRQCMVADVPLGAFLSGGIDSSLVVALMQASSPRPVKTFTIGFHEQGFDEAEHAKRVAAHLGTEHTEAYVTSQEAMAVIPHLAAMYDEPFADSSQIPTHLVAALARRHVTVSLSGDGGDELFGGYTRYLLHRSLWGRLEKVPRGARSAVSRALRRVPPAHWDRVARGVDPLLPRRFPRDQVGDKVHKLAGVLSLPDAESVYRALVSHWSDPAAVVLDSTEAPTALTDPTRRASLPDDTDRMMYLDAISYLPDDILVKVDRAAMAVSLETRVPLLDADVVEFAWRLPRDLKMRGDQGKWLLRQVLYRHVPRELVDRPKMGFGVPIGEWLRGPLRPWAEELLAPATLTRQGLLDPDVVAQRWSEHLGGVRDWKYHLWDVLMFQAWMEAYED